MMKDLDAEIRGGRRKKVTRGSWMGGDWRIRNLEKQWGGKNGESDGPQDVRWNRTLGHEDRRNRVSWGVRGVDRDQVPGSAG